MPKQSLPADVAPSCNNPPIWDNVVQRGNITCAIALTPLGRKKMYERGWCHAVEGKTPILTLSEYVNGYNDGLKDLEEDSP